MKKLIYFSCSALQRVSYDGGTSINASFLKYLETKQHFYLTGFGTNISKDIINFRDKINFNKFVIVRNHSEQNVFTGTILNLLSVLKNRNFFKLLIKGDVDFVWSGSDFWPDSIPAFLIKLFNKRIKWIASFYLFAPAPWSKANPYRINFKTYVIGLLYYLTQLPIYYIVKHFADIILVTSAPDIQKFLTKKRNYNSIIAVQGGVDINDSEEYLKSNSIISVNKRTYDACFVGRFHYQKGILELIDIWNYVVKDKKNAKLALIGVGPLEDQVRDKIIAYNLVDNIDLLGFMDGSAKHNIFKHSKIIVHPATYDSGGMAAAEGMAWKLPGVSFDLDALKSYYPKGMLKVTPGDLSGFAQTILNLLQYPTLYEKTSEDAYDLIKEVWDWNIRLKNIYESVFHDM